MTDTTDRLRAITQAATPGPWERGDVWQMAGTGFGGKDKDTCAYCANSGKPVWVGGADINGKMMRAHRHRDPEPYEPDHLISSPDGLVTGNYDYESGGVIDPDDAEYIATFDPQMVAAMLAVIEMAELFGTSHEIRKALARFREVAG